MTHEEAINWLNWWVQNDDGVEFYEEDGGLIMGLHRVNGELIANFVGKDVMECIEEASKEHPAT